MNEDFDCEPLCDKIDPQQYMRSGPAPNSKWRKIHSHLGRVVAHDSPHAKAFGIELATSGPDLAESVAASLPGHFIDDIEHYLNKWGHKRLNAYLKTRLPVSKQARSGDFGEVVATEILRLEQPDFEIPVNRLCWKDCPLPMRGDDILGFDFAASELRVMKAEAKSGVKITDKTVSKARAALNKNGGAPNSHSLGFIMEKLHAAGRDDEADKIEPWILDQSLAPRQITHCIFLVSGNDKAVDAIKDDAAAAQPPFTHIGLALRVNDHPGVVTKSYQLAVKDA